jgi:hypothetical protein
MMGVVKETRVQVKTVMVIKVEVSNIQAPLQHPQGQHIVGNINFLGCNPTSDQLFSHQPICDSSNQLVTMSNEFPMFYFIC